MNAIDKLGWRWVVVLKQERREAFQEARQLSAGGQKPVQEYHDALHQRQVQLWEVKDLTFTESYGRAVWVGHSHETWMETRIVGRTKTRQPKASDWWWML